MSAKILIVDDVLVLRQAIEQVLVGEGYTVVTAPDGRAALDLFKDEGADLILSDIRMPNMTGIELLQEAKKIKEVPVILMTGFADSCDAPTAYSIGVAGFLPKPFQRDEMIALVQSVLSDTQEPEASQLETEFSRVPVEDFLSGHEIQFDIFIRLTKTKFIKIAHHGEDLDHARVSIYKKKKVEGLYLKKKDYLKYVGINIQLMKESVKSTSIPNKNKLNFIRSTGKVILNKIKFQGLNKETFEDSKSFVESTLSTLGEDARVLELLSVLSRHADYLYAHSVAVSMMAVMIGRSAGWTSHVTLFKLAMGGLFHDIGKKDLGPHLVCKLRKDLTPEEELLLETHPVRGMEILSEMESIPDDVVQIAYQHHENVQGEGYPRGLRRVKIHPMARLIAVASEFCNLIFDGPYGKPISPIEAIVEIEKMVPKKFDPDFFNALQSMFPVSRDSTPSHRAH